MVRRISNAETNGVIVPMYSTVQAWNADESLMILYDQTQGRHRLLNGITYQFIRYLDDVNPADIEQIFWDFNIPDQLFYLERSTFDFIKYTPSTKTKQTIVNLKVVSGCSGAISMGNDIQMMSWDSDVVTFRCNNSSAYAYRISDQTLIDFSITDVNYTATSVTPSGDLYYHQSKVYNTSGNQELSLNESSTEHSCVGKLSNGNDAHFAIAFAQGPMGGCIGDIVAHDLTTGNCFTLTSQSQGYEYPQSGTHISALAHKNTEGGWIAASMIGYDRDGQSLLDQELIIAKAEEGNIKVCRIGHHRSDEDQFDYWGEPHAVISPSGTRVLFGSDWSGAEDGVSVDSYVVELPSFDNSLSVGSDKEVITFDHHVLPNPVRDVSYLTIEGIDKQKEFEVLIFDTDGKVISTDIITTQKHQLNQASFSSGIYFYIISDINGNRAVGKFIVE